MVLSCWAADAGCDGCVIVVIISSIGWVIVSIGDGCGSAITGWGVIGIGDGRVWEIGEE